MPRKKGGWNILRRVDRYADPINLTFNQKKVFQTPSGGCLTIISAIVLLTWFSMQVINTLQVQYDLSTKTNQLEIDPTTGQFPVFEIDPQSFVFAVKGIVLNPESVASDDSYLTQDEVAQYFSVVFEQYTFEAESNQPVRAYYPAMNCSYLELDTPIPEL